MQPYTLVRDERTGIEVKTPQVMQVLDGDLDEFMHAYLRHKTERQHKKGSKPRHSCQPTGGRRTPSVVA